MEEMNALRKSGTWKLVNLPKDQRIVECKWSFTMKCKADGSIKRYKVRLVAKGFTQKNGIDYQETFAPIVKVNSIKVLLSLAANCGWSLHKLDVKNAILNGDLQEEVFVSLSQGFEKMLGQNKVCMIKKFLYGLKQYLGAWLECVRKVVKSHGHHESQVDHAIFYK